MKKYVLYMWSESFGDYYEAAVTKCNICGKMFQIKKGFSLLDDKISCYKCQRE